MARLCWRYGKKTFGYARRDAATLKTPTGGEIQRAAIMVVRAFDRKLDRAFSPSAENECRSCLQSAAVAVVRLTVRERFDADLNSTRGPSSASSSLRMK